MTGSTAIPPYPSSEQGPHGRCSWPRVVMGTLALAGCSRHAGRATHYGERVGEGQACVAWCRSGRHADNRPGIVLEGVRLSLFLLDHPRASGRIRRMLARVPDREVHKMSELPRWASRGLGTGIALSLQVP